MLKLCLFSEVLTHNINLQKQAVYISFQKHAERALNEESLLSQTVGDEDARYTKS